jgi:MoaA/NifB/PqqE/SkfB family radical SAM enzyme
LWKNAGVNSLNISFDAYDEELVDAVYGMTGAWKRAFSAIKNYSKYFNTWITFTFYNQNFDEIKKVAKFCKKYGVRKLRINPMVPQGELDPVNPFTYMRLVKYVNELNKKYNYNSFFVLFFLAEMHTLHR